MLLSGCIIRGEQQPAPVDQAGGGEQQPTQPQPQQPVPTVPSVPTLPQQQPVARLSIRIRPRSQRRVNATMTGMVRCNRWWAKCCPRAVQQREAYCWWIVSVNNRTNGSINTGEATEVVRNALANNGKFTLITAQQLAVAKQQLGLSPQDSLGTRSKAIGIARNVGAQYVLYSNATGNANAPGLQMQLMLVQTGEIIWSGKGAVQQQ
ncbi:penicillin-binding protein activator LpoB [Enterobacter sp. EA-1]|nr:penicillin-binding protein activator LpoB [Enterobacter sp. EA-1]